MPTNRPLEDLQAAVGESTRSVEGLRVEAGTVAEFARAIHADHPPHRDPAAAERAGHPAVVAPLTFVRTADFPHHRTESVGTHKHYGHELGFDERFEVHGEESFEYHRPLYVGDVLSGETTLADVYTREGGSGEMTFVDLETVYRDGDGNPVVTQRTTTLELTDLAREAGESDDRDGDTGSPVPENADVGDPRVPAAAHTEYPTGAGGNGRVSAGDLSEGDRGPTRVLSGLKRTDFVRYAGASGDFNPIHYDEPYAMGAGNPSVFGQGMLVSGFVSTVLVEWFGVAPVERFATRFENRIWPGDTVEVTSTIDSLADGERTTTAEVALTAENDDGETLVTATADVELPREG